MEGNSILKPMHAAASPGSSNDLMPKALILLTFSLRLLFVFRYRVDSDEPQHLHVLWGWAHGMLQYRDFFDNHMPLFHWLLMPLYFICGDRPETLLVMRMAMLPLYALLLWGVARLGSLLFSRPTGLWCAGLTGLFPPLFLCAAEFRADNLWVVLWVWSLVALIGGRPTPRRMLLAGMGLGLAMAVSLKTLLLLFALALSGLMLLNWLPATMRPSPALFWRRACWLLTPLLLIPSAIAVCFLLLKAWRPFCYCLIAHNLFGFSSPLRMLLFPCSFLLVGWLASRLMRHIADPARQIRAVFVTLVALVYFASLNTLWPLLSLESYLPFYPLLIVLVAPLLLRHRDRAGLDGGGTGNPRPRRRVALFAAASVVLLLALGRPWSDQVAPTLQMLRTVLLLTGPEEAVVDLKGESVFRRRAFYHEFETISQIRAARGELGDEVAEGVLRHRACLATADNSEFPPRAQAFLSHNFISVGDVRVAGKVLPADLKTAAGGNFVVVIPAEYVVLSIDGLLHGTMDGRPFPGQAYLEAGTHRFVADQPFVPGAWVLFWARAWHNGFRPAGEPRPDNSGIGFH